MAHIKRISVKSRSKPIITTVEDLPQDMWDVIVGGLTLLDHYTAMATLIAPHARRASSYPKEWFLKGLEISCIGMPKFDSNGIQYDTLVKSYEFCLEIVEPGVGKDQSLEFFLEFFEPGLGKEQDVDLEIKSNEQEISTSQVLYRKHFAEMASDSGLLFCSVGEFHSTSTPWIRHADFVVLNPVNLSSYFLPPVYYMCNCPSSSDCSCKPVPLKLVVDVKQDSGLNSCHTAFYKAYIFEGRKGRNVFGDPLQAKKNSRGISGSWSFRISAYDSRTRSWSFTGLQWYGESECRDTQVFPMEDGTFYICASYYKAFGQLYVMYKFQNGVQVAKVKPPYTKKAKDMECEDPCHLKPSDCNCISTTFFEDEGQIFFFKQTSWMGTYGPNCISATIWQLDKEAMVWDKLPTIPTHKLETCSTPYLFDTYLENSAIFKCEGSLLVATQVFQRGGYWPGYWPDVVHVAAFNISKKTWCKLPETFLTASWGHERRREANCGDKDRWRRDRSCNVFDLDRFVFQPNVNRRA